MVDAVDDLIDLPRGSHCLGLYASREEAASLTVDFLTSTPPGQAASFWVGDPSLAAYYNERLSEEGSDQVGCVHVLDHEQVEPIDGHLRPTEEIREFVSSHPDGVTGGADTISDYWSAETAADHLEYERWFQEQPRAGSRFLCPYDLRRVPTAEAPEVLRELGRHHTHAWLSASQEPAVRLLQLFIFGRPADIPRALRESLSWARDSGLVRADGPDRDLVLTPAGEKVVAEWSRSATLG